MALYPQRWKSFIGQHIYTILSWLIILAPFLWYGWVIFKELNPMELSDSFTYLWRQPINRFYFTGRSLTQRILFSLAGTQPAVIARLHFSLYLLSAGTLYLLLKRPGHPAYNLIPAAIIAFFFSSYTLNAAAELIIVEPIFVVIALIFPFVLFLARGRYRTPLILVLGILFIFSKNIAPYTMIILLIVHWFTRHEGRTRIMLRISVFLSIIALTSIAITTRYDTSTQINTVNNIYKQVLPDEKLTAYFQDTYGMPDGPFIEACRGAWIGAPCFGSRLIRESPITRNYELVTDQYGFVTWIQQGGQRAYLKYLLWDAVPSTYHRFQQGIHDMMHDKALIVLNIYLGLNAPMNTPNNLATLTARGPGGEIGFFGFDPFLVIRDLLLVFKFDHLEVIFFFLLTGFILTQRYKDSQYLPLATGMMAAGLVLFFLGFFGDSMEEPRHVFVGLIALEIGGGLYLVSIIDLGWSAVRHWRRSQAKAPMSP